MNEILSDDIRDVKPVEYPPDSTLLVVVLVLAGILLAALLYFFIKNQRRKKQAGPGPKRPAWEIALERLEQVRQQNLPAKGQIKEYYSLCSEIIRRYIEERFHIRAPEMTTEEFLGHLQISSHLIETHKEILKEFLNACDLVKFARHQPGPTEIEEIYRRARQFVEETTDVQASKVTA